jgi:hypothetical protein
MRGEESYKEYDLKAYDSTAKAFGFGRRILPYGKRRRLSKEEFS